MSVEYDDKIVRMQFDNKGFESGVSSTLRSLEDLKSALKFDSISTGLDQIGSSVKGLSFDNLANGIEQTIVKIPVMGTVMDQTIRNMTNSVEGFVKNTLDKFSALGNAKDGFSEYELQIGAVKTIQASTGEDIATINMYLDQLNKYADDTIYSFSDMTQNIGKFTNAGVELKDAVAAIQGVANVAAVSGANTNEASRAMYNFSQALSQGAVKLIDWKSIENANMATVEFKNELIKTAVELGTLVQQGDQYVSTTKDMTGKTSSAFDAVHSFNESLSSQWMTTDVLVKTLNKYTDTTTAIGQKATEAATRVNTFHQAMDAIVEDLGSNWTMAWRYIIGDFEEATEMWSKFKDAIGEIFKPAADARNAMLEFWSTNRGEAEDAVDATADMTERQKELYEVAMRGYNLEFGVGEERKRILTQMGYDYSEVQSIINGVCDGSVKSWEDVTIAIDKSTESVKNNAKQMTGREMVLKGISNLWHNFTEILWAVRQAWQDVFPKTTGEQLVAMSKAFMEFTDKIRISAQTTLDLRNTLRGIFSVLSILFSLVKAVVGGIVTAISTMTKAFSGGNGRPLKLAGEIGNLIYALDQLIKESGIFTVVFNGIGKVIGSVGYLIITIIKSLINILGTFFKTLFGFEANGIDFSDFTGSFSDAATAVSTYVTSIAEKIASFASIPVSGIVTLVEKVKGAFGGFTQAGGLFEKAGNVFLTIWEKIKMVFTVIAAALSPLVDLIKRKMSDLMGGTVTFDDFVKFLKDGGGLIILGELISIIHSLKKIFKNSESIGESISNMFESIGDAGKALTNKIKAGLFKDIAIALAIMVGSVFLLSKINPDDLAVGLGAFSVIVAELSMVMKKLNTVNIVAIAAELFALGVSVMLLTLSVALLAALDPEKAGSGIAFIGILMGVLSKSVKSFQKFVGKLDGVAATIVALAVAINLLVIPCLIFAFLPAQKILKGILLVGLLMTIIVALTAGMQEYSGKYKGSMDGFGKTFLALAVAINLLMVPVLIMAFLPMDKLIQGGIAMLALMGLLTAAMWALTIFSKNAKDLDSISGTLLSFTVCIVILAIVVNALAKMNTGDLTKGIVALFFIMAFLVIAIAVITNVTKSVNAENFLAVVLILAVGIAALAAVFLLLGEMDENKFEMAIIGFSVIVAVLVLAIVFLSSYLESVDIKSLIAITLSLAILIALLAGVMLAFSTMGDKDLNKALIGLGALVVAVAVLGLALAGITKLFSNSAMATGAKNFAMVLGVVVGSVAALVGAIALLIDALIALDKTDFGADFLAKVGLLAAAIGILVGGLLEGILVTLFGWIPTAIEAVVTGISMILQGLLAVLSNLLSTDLLPILEQIGQFLVDNTPMFVEKVIDIISGVLSTIAENGAKIAEWAADACKIIASIISGLAAGIGPIVDSVIEWLGELASNLKEKKDEIAEAIGEALTAIWDVAWKVLSEYIVAPLAEFGVKFFATIVSGMIGAINGVIDFVVGGVETIINGIIDIINDLFSISLDNPFGKGKLFEWSADIKHVNFDRPTIGTPDWVTAVLAKGGSVKDGSSALVGEAGPEILQNFKGVSNVVPLTHANAKAGTKSLFGDYMDDMHNQLAALNDNLTRKDEPVNTYDGSNVVDALGDLSDKIIKMGEELANMKLVMDTGAVVGQLAKPLDKKLGQISSASGRAVGKVSMAGKSRR